MAVISSAPGGSCAQTEACGGADDRAGGEGGRYGGVNPAGCRAVKWGQGVRWWRDGAVIERILAGGGHLERAERRPLIDKRNVIR